MKENLADLFLTHFCSNQFGFDKLFRSVFDEDRVIVLLDNDRLIKNKNFILHYGKVYICTMIDDENMYMEEAMDNQKMQIITDVLNGAKMKYNDFNLFDDETMKKLKALKELDFSEVIQLQGEPDGYFYLFFQTVDFNYNVHYNLKIKGNDEIYNFFDKLEKMPIRQFLENGGFQFGGFRIPTEDLINAKRDINIIYQNDKE